MRHIFRVPGACIGAILAGRLIFPTAVAQEAGALQRGAVWYGTGFEEPGAMRDWRGQSGAAPGFESGRSVLLTSEAASKGAVITRRLPVEQVRGCMVRGTVMVRAEGVSAKPNSWNGIKSMLIIETPAGKEYPQAPLETGTFDWRPARFVARIPSDATNATLVLGLEQVSGKAWFDDLKLAVVKSPVKHPAAAAGPMYTGHSVPRFRGTMISPSITPESLRTLGGDWNANLIRWQLIRSGGDARAGEAGYDIWLEDQLRRLDAALPLCEKLGVCVVVDLHSPPGGRPTAGGYTGSDAGLFTDKRSQEKFVGIWRKIALRYKDAKAIWGYDLVNEPVEDDVAEDCSDWQELAERAARAVREVDPARTIIIEPAKWGSPEGLEELVPIAVSNVVYSVHMYIPHAFTHQNVHGKTPAYVYPGEIQGKYWDKEQLKGALRPAIDFQKRYNVQIYIGEFSAIRWAPDNSAERYLKDVIDILEENGWDWTYHAFREWSGWSVEYGNDPKDTQPAAAPTGRQQLLRKWFAKNRKPW